LAGCVWIGRAPLRRGSSSARILSRMASATTLESIDLENDAFVERIPHETFALLRREAPVYWYDWPGGRGYWCVTKHADVVAVSRDTKTYSSAEGANLEDLEEDQKA